MATREENLKKINEELEAMSDEELEQVAGGTLGQTADDSRFLNVLLNGTTKCIMDRKKNRAARDKLNRQHSRIKF